MKLNKTILAIAVAGSLLSSSQAFAEAVLLDGTVLTPTAEVFATEGAIWDIDLNTQQITVTGKTLTIADSIDGFPLSIFGSSVLGQDGEAATGITAATFERLSDVHATTTGVTTDRCGAVRSLFSTSEAQRTDAPAGLDRFPATQAKIQANYFAMVRAAYADQAHTGQLPAGFLQNAGIDRDDGNGGLMDVYPTTAGGTLKSAGHVYNDVAGNPHFITDIETVLELSENVSGGPVKSASQGVPPLIGIDGQCMPGYVPASFVIGDLLVIFSPDPRFGADVLGLGEAHIPRQIFFDQIAANPGTPVDIIGHLVGEHVMFVQEVLTDFTDPTAGVTISADRFRFRNDRGELRFIGTVDKPENLSVRTILTNGTDEIASFGITLIVDPLIGGASYTVRERDVNNLASVTTIIVEATNTETGEVTSETYIRSQVEE